MRYWYIRAGRAIPEMINGPLTDTGYYMNQEKTFLELAGEALETVNFIPFRILIHMVSAKTGDEIPYINALEKPAENVRPLWITRQVIPFKIPVDAVKALVD